MLYCISGNFFKLDYVHMLNSKYASGKGIQSKRPQVKTSPTLRSQIVPRPKRPQAKNP
jgi:hypothetical protein